MLIYMLVEWVHSLLPLSLWCHHLFSTHISHIFQMPFTSSSLFFTLQPTWLLKIVHHLMSLPYSAYSLLGLWAKRKPQAPASLSLHLPSCPTHCLWPHHPSPGPWIHEVFLATIHVHMLFFYVGHLAFVLPTSHCCSSFRSQLNITFLESTSLKPSHPTPEFKLVSPSLIYFSNKAYWPFPLYNLLQFVVLHFSMCLFNICLPW